MGEENSEIPKIRIFGDSWTKDDRLGFKDYVDILQGVIDNFEDDSPLTIGIHGRWGRGKTSLMRMLEDRFEGKDIKTVWFDSWAYGKDESIGIALLQKILNEFENKREAKKMIKGIGRLFADLASRKITGITLEEAEEHFMESAKLKSTLRDDFKDIINKVLKEGERLVIFIDDLDRCLPEQTIEILEMIKNFLDVPPCIFVIGVEKEVIEKGIEIRYKEKDQDKLISGKDYIEKIIQVPFNLPPIRKDAMEEYIREMTEDLDIKEEERGYIEVVCKGTGTGYNPRKVKMFLNIMRIRLAIGEKMSSSFRADICTKLFVLEYVFTDYYKDFLKYRDQEILTKLEELVREEDYEELKKGFEDYPMLERYYEDEDLRSILADEPYLRGIDLEPYIYLSEAEVTKDEEEFDTDESLMEDLLSRDFIKGEHAADKVNKMPDPKKVQILNKIIAFLRSKDDNRGSRVNAAWALGRIGDERAVDALEGALKDEDYRVRESAAEALVNIGGERAVEALKGALKDKNPSVRGNAAEALGEIGGERALDALVEALKDEDSGVRGSAAWALGRIGDERAVDALIDALKDKNPYVCGSAAWALGRIGDERAVDALVETLKDEDSGVRVNAAEALGRIGDERAV
ncbi:MAG: HEAT repeat domain-containing protein, partial [Halobacteriota archaeon]|nr:HEAT repeat domain-containing protein [Halobacteriota archaeon]